jgi:gamma-glutamyl:cysteine ligase YbdK (ATP-grasp superfamily)
VDGKPLGLFEAVGVELEYAIVHRDSLDVYAIADQIIERQLGHIASDVEFDDIDWSNELILHMIEVKTADPRTPLDQLAAMFDRHLAMIRAHAEGLGARLMPTAAHPWMDPATERRIWPHENSEIYDTFDRIFTCRTHGWSNVQALHVNLPFANDDEFGRLHAAIRLILPLIPAIAASSPILDSHVNGVLDRRLDAYRRNCHQIASITARVIPEPVFTQADYATQIFERMYRDIAPHDPNGIMREEWLNARGAIARFDRNTIEIRVIDVQECPAADIAVTAAIVQVLKLLVAEQWSSLASQQAWEADPLADLLEAVMRDGERALIDNADYLRAFGCDKRMAAGELWRRLIEQVDAKALAFCREQLDVILNHGPAARRILAAVDGDLSRAHLADVYRSLCDCLDRGEMFVV